MVALGQDHETDGWPLFDSLKHGLKAQWQQASLRTNCLRSAHEGNYESIITYLTKLTTDTVRTYVVT
jgi:hypothetical protein